jgi:uncharacterized membrane protein YfcA
MYFPTAEIEISIWIPPVVSFCISLLTSMGGISGAFLLMPFQMSFLNYTTPSVSATNQLFNVIAIPSGVYRYIKEGRMVWPLTWAVIIGTMPGVIFGALIRVYYLPEPTKFKIFAGFVLGYIGLRMVRDLWFNKNSSKLQRNNKTCTNNNFEVNLISNSRTIICYEFSGTTYTCSKPLIYTMSFIVGIIGGIYGIGGGAIVAPFFVSICGLPVHTIAGAALMGTLATSVIGVAFYKIIEGFNYAKNNSTDWKLGILFGIGGALGMYCGARLQKHVPSFYIKIMICMIILWTSYKYIKPILNEIFFK